MALTRYVAEEYAHRGIRANSVAAGWTRTNLAKTSQQLGHPDDSSWQVPATPQKRIYRIGTAPMRRAAASFIIFSPDRISWVAAGLIAISSMVGGAVGARYGRRFSPKALHACILVLGLVGLCNLLS